MREVYEIHRWHPARTLRYETRDLTARKAKGRWEFEGVVAEGAVRDMYRLRSVKAYVVPGSRNPFLYVNC